MSRPATATFNLAAIRCNYRLAKSLANNRKAVAIIKGNAYGHGAVAVARALADEADAFGVACIEEALELRNAGIKNPILLLEGFFNADELPLIAQHNLWCAVHSIQQIEALKNSTLQTPISVWLKMDTGMHRLGIAPERYASAYHQLKRLPQVNNIVLMSHFSSADNLQEATTQEQIQCFDSIIDNLDAEVSLANSAATLGTANARRDWQRPGIMLYGATPFAHSHPQGDQLQAGMILSSEVIAIHYLQQGDAIGYSRNFVCDQPTIVGTVAMGYADGYPRSAKSGTPVMVNGQRTQLLGRVSMDMMAIDLTHIKNAEVGAYVELWGDNLLASEVAPYCDTIPYTLFTGITRRVKKVYSNIRYEVS
jgi:alanine racemase